jgi:hypothetical protein
MLLVLTAQTQAIAIGARATSNGIARGGALIKGCPNYMNCFFFLE